MIINLNLYTTKKELDNTKNGVNTIIAYMPDQKPNDAIYPIIVPLCICDILENEVRINLAEAENQLELAGEMVGYGLAKVLEEKFKGE